MNIENIKDKYSELSKELKQVLSTMQRSDRVFVIRDEIKDLQALCPHSNGNYDFSDTGECPYCGRKFKE